MQAINLEFSLGNFESLFSFKKLFENIKDSFEKEQKQIVVQKQNEREEDILGVFKFFFTSPDKI